MKDAATASPDLSALIASRIVHDLTSPLGAVGNGLEMLELSGTPAGPEIDLIAQSVALAKARLRFLRLAFGAAAPGQLVSGSEIAAALSGPVGAARLAIDWQPADGAERTLVKLAFLSLMCLESAMPFGGSVTVATEGARWRLSGRAERFRPLPDCWAALADTAPPPGTAPAMVHFAMAALTARQTGRSLEVTAGDDRIDITF
jgi:histidine phosphotransferase ChpT